jgi:hypothetical protein
MAATTSGTPIIGNPLWMWEAKLAMPGMMGFLNCRRMSQ